MSKDRWAFRPSVLTGAIKAAMKAGVDVDRAEIEPATGKIVIVVGKSAALSADITNEWEDWNPHDKDAA
jgi:hypothetical protein